MHSHASEENNLPENTPHLNPLPHLKRKITESYPRTMITVKPMHGNSFCTINLEGSSKNSLRSTPLEVYYKRLIQKRKQHKSWCFGFVELISSVLAKTRYISVIINNCTYSFGAVFFFFTHRCSISSRVLPFVSGTSL